jgi:hypothetical protein
MEKEQYNQPLFKRLLDDDLFLPWITHPSQTLNDYWNSVMQNEPEKAKTIRELRMIIKGMNVIEKEFSIEDKQEVWRKIEAGTQHSRIRHLLRLLRYAAVFLLVIAASVYIYTTRSGKTESSINYQSLLSNTPVLEESSENVLIVLGNQEKIEVKEKNVELVYDAEGRMSVNAEVIDTPPSQAALGKNVTQVYVPYGRTTSLIMSDGSKIWVNSGSRIIYPVVFSDTKREIYVEGEIYLEVARNEKLAFVVKTDLLEIQVLGTAFNVSAYKNDSDQSVVLANGSVAIKELSKKVCTAIKPNQKYTLDKGAHTSRLQEVDVMDNICWKYGFLVFRNEPLNHVLKKIERYYNVSLVYDASLAGHTTLSGKLDLKEKVEDTFRILSITAPINYAIHENEIIINVKP